MTVPEFLARATRVLFFTGKGGVGKTSLACTTAVTLAGRGRKVLVVSTDPASNLDEVLGARFSAQPSPVPGVPGLFALNLDPVAAAAAYRERIVAPYRGVLPPAAIQSMEEQLSGACTVEIAAFDEFTKLLGDARATAAFDHVIFDTAPTGHTLRLLKLPAAWTGFIAANTTGTSCLGPLAGLQKQQTLYESSLRALADPAATTLVLVARPDAGALAEAARTQTELAAIGMANQLLIVNAIFQAAVPGDATAAALQARCDRALAELPVSLAVLPRLSIPLLPRSPMGAQGLDTLFDERAPQETALAPPAAPPEYPGLSRLADDLERGGSGAVLAMGKGGVGKTTIAAAIAVELAHRGHSVHLTTTDPAAHVHDAVGAPPPGLRVTRIDPAAETRRYTAEVVARAAPSLDAQGLALLEEDLRSPCTEEIAVFRAFAEAVSRGEGEFVIIDTAPTGHTLLLLDAAEAYHREITRTASEMPAAVRQLLPRLRDARYTRVILVTLPEATPVHEAARLQDDLRRAGITPFAWVVNQSFSPLRSGDPLLAERGARELPFLAEVEQGLAQRILVVPWSAAEPSGAAALRRLAQNSPTEPAPAGTAAI